MKRFLFFQLLLLSLYQAALGISIPSGLVNRTGDLSVVLHWNPNSDSDLAGYRVYRSTNSLGPFTLLTASLLASPGYCDLSGINNGQTYYYQVTAVNSSSQESSPTAPLAATPHPFASDDEFLDYIQEVHFDYFWYLANPNNGLIPDRSAQGSACSIAAVGFGLTAIGIAVDHGWISRTQATARVQTTLNTFLQGPQGSNTSGTIGYNGWFYHFLNMNSALRSSGSELSSIDTVLLLGGVLYAKQYFNGTNAAETSIRTTADAIFNRVNWTWMAQGTDAVAMGWTPETGFSTFGNWVGYDEGMLIYVLGLGTATNPLPSTAWSRWTNGYTWQTFYGLTFVPFSPLFGHQYSHCWIDFRHTADAFMNSHNTTYFVNSRRASLAQQSYCVANPLGRVGYSSTVWGLTACDGPAGYAVYGTNPLLKDDGTIAPTAAGGSMAFTPEKSLPTFRYYYGNGRARLWTAYGFRDGFNIGQQWYGPDELGIDQGPIVIMIENYRSQKVWKLFMQNVEVQRGLQRAGFVSLPYVPVTFQFATNAFSLLWTGTNGRTYEIEYSSDLLDWIPSPTGELTATNNGPVTWTDSSPLTTQRFYRVYQLGAP